MLVELNIQNVSSFNKSQTFSMVSSTATKEDHATLNTIAINKFGIGSILKSAAIFGANASGKSNLIECMMFFRRVVLNSLLTADSDTLDSIPPFLLKENFFDFPSELEISFIRNDILYRYGISFSDGDIKEEWLYRNQNIRETRLFHRVGQSIEFNSTSFSEAKDFTSENEKGVITVSKTKSNVPFVSVLSQFDGKISSEVIGWFEGFNLISGIKDDDRIGYTLDKFEKDENFRVWASDILKNFQIDDLIVSTPEPQELKGAGFFKKKNKVVKHVEIFKQISGELSRAMPLSLESEGTRKVIFMLGPIYDSIVNNKVLFIDEFDSKFHTLLSKYLIGLFHQKSVGCSQLLITTHDTNLLSKKIFRRDQVWFVEKNIAQESELFSLLEYKEHYTRKSSSYRQDYLAGKYGAIPLFNDNKSLEEAING